MSKGSSCLGSQWGLNLAFKYIYEFHLPHMYIGEIHVLHKILKQHLLFHDLFLEI